MGNLTRVSAVVDHCHGKRFRSPRWNESGALYIPPKSNAQTPLSGPFVRLFGHTRLRRSTLCSKHSSGRESNSPSKRSNRLITQIRDGTKSSTAYHHPSFPLPENSQELPTAHLSFQMVFKGQGCEVSPFNPQYYILLITNVYRE